MILCWDRCSITDKTLDVNGPDLVPVCRENKTAFEVDIAVPLTHNLPKTGAEKVTRYENLLLEIKNVWRHIAVSVYPLVISADRVVTNSFLKYIQNTWLTRNFLRVGQKNRTNTNVSYDMQIPSTRPLTLGDRMNFLPLTEPNLTDSLGLMKASQQIDAEKCGYSNNSNNVHLIYSFRYFLIRPLPLHMYSG